MNKKNCSQNCSCPNCKSATSLTDYWTLFLTLEEWPAGIIALSLVSITSNFLLLPPYWTAIFALVSVVPVLFTITKKKSCLLCGIEFEDQTSKNLGNTRISHYE